MNSGQRDTLIKMLDACIVSEHGWEYLCDGLNVRAVNVLTGRHLYNGPFSPDYCLLISTLLSETARRYSSVEGFLMSRKHCGRKTTREIMDWLQGWGLLDE